MKIYLSRMISELLEDLTSCISGYIWFIKEGKEEISSTGLYNPKVGPEESNNFLGTICYRHLFKSHKFVQQIKKNLTSFDLNSQESKYRLWKYI